MKRKRPPKVRFFRANCPNCGSSDTKLDMTALENLKRVPLSVVTATLTLPGIGTPVRLRCCACKSRFLG